MIAAWMKGHVLQVLVRSFPCEMQVLPVLRRTLERWLANNAVDSESRAAAVMATHEAAANAIEHGKCDKIELEGLLESDVIYIEVRADGSWQTPSNDNDERGRGLLLIEALMESVTIAKHSNCTSVQMRRHYGPITEV
jgi:anti-sigma regulatory factor (Ser/Thr protein kinase)